MITGRATRLRGVDAGVTSPAPPMSFKLRCPTHVYEIIPDHFVPGSERPLLAIRDKLDHIASLGVDGISLTPLFPGDDELRLHTTDFDRIDPKLGTEADLEALCDAAAQRGMSVTLMGVFDHVSERHPWFRSAMRQVDEDARFLPEQRTRAYFSFGEQHKTGYACRDGSSSEPELDLRNAEVRRRMFTGEESVLHRWMRAGAGGWRILRAEQVGYSILRELQRGSRNIEGSHFLVGDIKGFADRYQRDGLLDAVVNHYSREAVLAYLKGDVPARQLARVQRDLQKYYEKSLSRSWNLLSGHDTPRLPTILAADHPVKSAARVRLATLLGYTLPGAAHVLFGEETGLAATHALPATTPMSWDPSTWHADTLALHRQLGALRRQRAAFRTGELVDMTPEGEWEVFSFARVTADPRETAIVVVNRSERPQTRKLFAPISDLVDGLLLKDVLAGRRTRVRSGSLHLEVQAQEAVILVPDDEDEASARFFRGY
jgi:glycosidase